MKQNLFSLALCLAALTLGGCHSNREPGADAKAGKGSDTTSGGSDTSSQEKDKAGSVPSDSVRIEPADQARAGIGIAPVTVRSMPRTLDVAGEVAMDERHTDHIGALADGRITAVSVLPGDAVRRGQTLATLHSHSVHDTVASLAQAFAAVSRQQSAVTFATEARDRYAKLFAIQAASLEERQRSEQDLAEARKALVDAQANVRAEKEHLSELLQVPPDSLNSGNLYQKELIPVRAVSNGVVITRNITPGQVVTTGDDLFVTTDLANVWVNAAVNEKDLPSIHRGASASVSTGQTANSQTATDQPANGRVTMLGDVVDPHTRTLPVRLSVPNPGTRLRPGMFVTASIAEPTTRTAVFVPAAALQDINGFRVVFVTTDGATFQVRAVKTGQGSKGMVEILEGLAPADRLVVNGAFMVKSQLLKGAVGEG